MFHSTVVKDLHKEKCPTCGESLWLKTLITLTKDEKPIFSFCVGTRFLEELCISLKMQGIANPMEYLRNLWQSEYERHGTEGNWCSKTKTLRCLRCGTEIRHDGEKPIEAYQKHLEVCPALTKVKNKTKKKGKL